MQTSQIKHRADERSLLQEGTSSLVDSTIKDYFAAIDEFDSLWASKKSSGNQARMDDLICTIQTFESQRKTKDRQTNYA